MCMAIIIDKEHKWKLKVWIRPSLCQTMLYTPWCSVTEGGLEFSGHLWKLFAVNRRYSNIITTSSFICDERL